MLVRKHLLFNSYPSIGFRLAGWRFAPGLASTLMVLFLVPILLFLGHWQWQRFQYKTARTQTQETRKLTLTLLQANILQKEGALQDLQGGYLHTEGQFLNQYAIFVDNQSFKGQPGYKVLTPLLVTELVARQPSPTYVLVDRGWIPLGHSRAILPTLPPIAGMVHIEGRLYQPVQGFKLPRLPAPPPPHSEGGDLRLRVLDIDLKSLEQALGHTIYPLILRLEPGDKLGFEILPFVTQAGMPPIKHLGYAWQWFMMALTVLIYYCVINTSSLKK